MWHFKSNNPDIVSVAMSGDQTALKQNSIGAGYVDLKAPQSHVNKYIIVVDSSKLNEFNIAGNSRKGGFAMTPFGSTTYDAYWTVKGDNPNFDTFECGSSHKSSDPTNIDESPQTVSSHHSVWFRGLPLKEDEARDRYLDNVTK
jgi:hypothetical protein